MVQFLAHGCFWERGEHGGKEGKEARCVGLDYLFIFPAYVGRAVEQTLDLGFPRSGLDSGAAPSLAMPLDCSKA